MDETRAPDHRLLDRLRPAIIAIVASLVAIGGIAIATSDDAGSSVSLTAGTSTIDSSTIDSAAAPAAVSETVGSVGSVADTVITAVTVAASVAETSTTAVPVADAVSSASAPDAAGLPSIDARAFAVYDATSNTWLAEGNSNVPIPVGSVMKLLTTYVILQAGDMSKVVTVPPLQVDISESSIGLYAGERLPRDVLVRAMLIVSANDAARTLAIDIAGSTAAFVEQMNTTAAQLGLSETIAANPIGLDAAGAHSSARDMVTVAALLMRDDTFRQAVAKTTARLHGQTFVSTNRLLTTYPGADGIKTGHTTDAGYCLVGSATRDGRQIIVAVMGAASDDTRVAGASALLDWAFAQR